MHPLQLPSCRMQFEHGTLVRARKSDEQAALLTNCRGYTLPVGGQLLQDSFSRITISRQRENSPTTCMSRAHRSEGDINPSRPLAGRKKRPKARYSFSSRSSRRCSMTFISAGQCLRFSTRNTTAVPCPPPPRPCSAGPGRPIGYVLSQNGHRVPRDQTGG